MSLGQRITERRIACGLSQYQLSKLLEVSRQAVSKWENDKSVPDAIKMIKLAEVLDTDIEYLSTGRINALIRPPIVVNTIETVETIVEKPVVEVIETVVEKVIEKPVIQYIEKPVVKKIYRKLYIRNPAEYIACGVLCAVLGFIIGLLF